MRVVDIARVCHEARRAYCEVLGDFSVLPWLKAPKHESEAMLAEVAATIADPTRSGVAAHLVWRRELEAQGWKAGPLLNARKKEHPNLVRFDDLLPTEQTKRRLVTALIRVLEPR